MKTCVTCSQSKQNDDFHRGKGKPPFDECRACRVEAKKSRAKGKQKETYKKDYLVTEDVPCMRCGELVKVEVERGYHVKYKFCHSCIKLSSDGEQSEYADTREKNSKPIVFNLPVKTYRPGDRGFAQRAAEVMAHHAATPLTFAAVFGKLVVSRVVQKS